MVMPSPDSQKSCDSEPQKCTAETIVAALFSIMLQIIPVWLRQYQKPQLLSDILAGLVVGVLVIPQSLGYAVLAGLPPEYGLYAAIVPVIVYAWAGTSNVQAVGAVAITAIMTANGLAEYANPIINSTASINDGMQKYASMAMLLAVMVGAILWLAGKLKLGWIMQFISRGVSSGFVSGAAVLIFISQIKYFTGIHVSGSNVYQSISSIYVNFSQFHTLTALLGLVGFILLFVNKYANKWVWHTWLAQKPAKWLQRIFPLMLIILFIVMSSMLDWDSLGVHVIGKIPSGLPHFALPYVPTMAEFLHLLPTAGLTALIAFVSSSSVASHYARQRNEKFNANNELKALGLANFTGGFFQSFAVAGGFSRTAINVDSGANTPLASIVTMGVMLLVLLFLGSVISPLPYALLGATIMVSILALIDYKTLFYAWRVDKLDAINMGVTFLAVLTFGLNMGLVAGLLVSFANLIWQSSRPHIAIVGVLAGTEHFRNINRHDVETFDNLLIMRVDESLFFGNSEAVHNQVHQAIRDYPYAKEIVLILSAVNYIDFTAQEMLINLNNEIMVDGKSLNYSVIKGPVMDIIEQSKVIQELSGTVFLSTIEAVRQLSNNY